MRLLKRGGNAAESRRGWVDRWNGRPPRSKGLCRWIDAAGRACPLSRMPL